MLSPLSLLCLASSISAHFILNYPTPWYSDEDSEPMFCGGGNRPSDATRTVVALNGQDMLHVSAYHDSWTIGAFITYTENPTNFSDFSIPTSGTASPNLVPYTKGTGLTESCISVDTSKIAGIKNGTNATILIQFNGGDGNLYGCTDVTFSDAAQTNSTGCSNSASATLITAAAVSTSTSTSTATSTPNGAGRLPFSLSLGLVAMLIYCAT